MHYLLSYKITHLLLLTAISHYLCLASMFRDTNPSTLNYKFLFKYLQL